MAVALCRAGFPPTMVYGGTSAVTIAPAAITAPSVATWLPVREPDLTVGVVLREERRYNAQPDVAFLPLHDAPPVQWALIWRTDSATPLVRALAEAATDCGDASAESSAGPSLHT
ncbi:hypothetical protein [Streptomyces sp. 11-1-2]|uniref:hypothetical protein n=1 Tax=unclassified Streptomyces TaxID=2593676 RepID=UPI001968BC7F|nr:hypothetical protein [Streptomyces sp. 11-1-2]